MNKYCISYREHIKDNHKKGEKSWCKDGILGFCSYMPHVINKNNTIGCEGCLLFFS